MLIYLLPGVGCDARMFARLELPGHTVNVLEWPPFPRGCTLQQLAERMSAEVDAAKPHVLAGVSMGGMVAQELALITKPEKVVMISSWKGPREWPWYVHAAKTLRLTWLINGPLMRMFWPARRMLGTRAKDMDALLWDMALGQGPSKIRHGVQAIFRWKGSTWDGPVYRIHGDADHVIPLRFPVDHLVHGGQHIMVLNRAEEVAKAVLVAVEN